MPIAQREDHSTRLRHGVLPPFHSHPKQGDLDKTIQDMGKVIQILEKSLHFAGRLLRAIGLVTAQGVNPAGVTNVEPNGDGRSGHQGADHQRAR
jgi:hypothetical protein